MAASTAVHSNALNFLSFVQSGVDSRTGQYTVNLALPEIKCNNLNGPILPLGLSFNPLNTRNSGFGQGWELRQSQFDTNKRILSLSSGETFKVTGTIGDDGRQDMAEQKLKNFHFYQDEPNLYRIVHKSGMIELLRLEGALALPETVYSAEGYKVSLDYQPFSNGVRRLRTVTDGQGELLLQVNMTDQEVEILLRPDGIPGGALARVLMKLQKRGGG